MDELLEVFTREATVRGIRVVEVLPDGRLVAEYRGTQYTVGLENLARQFAQHGNPDVIENFLNTIVDMGEGLPDWEEARDGLRLVVEHADVEVGDTIGGQVTDCVLALLAYVDDDETRITFVTPDMLENWDISSDVAWEVAGENMATLLDGTPLQVEEIGGMTLGMFDSNSVFKASLILAPNCREVLEPALGWPLYAVIPCRDFAYVFADEELIGHLGATVVNEFKNSAYPITAEVLALKDDGIEAIGTFPTE